MWKYLFFFLFSSLILLDNKHDNRESSLLVVLPNVSLKSHRNILHHIEHHSMIVFDSHLLVDINSRSNNNHSLFSPEFGYHLTHSLYICCMPKRKKIKCTQSRIDCSMCVFFNVFFPSSSKDFFFSLLSAAYNIKSCV